MIGLSYPAVEALLDLYERLIPIADDDLSKKYNEIVRLMRELTAEIERREKV